jgi:hypothetical protein
VLYCICARLTTTESLEYIKTKSNGNIRVSEDYFKHVKSSLKKDFEKQLEYFHNDRFAFIQSSFFDRVEEFNIQQRILHDIIENNKSKPDVQIKAVHELHALSVDLVNIHQALPGLLTFEINAEDIIVRRNSNSSSHNLPLEQHSQIQSIEEDPEAQF